MPADGGWGRSNKQALHIGVTTRYSHHCVFYVLPRVKEPGLLSLAIISQTRIRMERHRSVLLKITALGRCAARSDPGREGRG